MKPLRIVFMGTPDFAVPTLRALIESEHTVVSVFCQPDKPKGRGQKLQMPPVKELALAHHIPVYQPTSLRGDEMEQCIREMHADVMIVIAYGRILPENLLGITPYGAINLHGSILPAYRGAAPIQWSVLNGDNETGITIMQMDKGMDTGAILEVIRTSIEPNETSGELFNRLAQLGGNEIVGVLNRLTSGELQPTPQDESKATYAEKITKEMGRINWNQSAKHIHCQIRGLNPWPSAYTFWKGNRLRIWASRIDTTLTNTHHTPGTILANDAQGLAVQTKEGVLRILEVQLDNKKRMPIQVFLTGHSMQVGETFDGEL